MNVKVRMLDSIIKFPDKRWTKNSINGEVKKVRNSRHVNRQFWPVIFVTFGDAISNEYYLSKPALAVIHVSCLNVCRLCVPNIMSLGACF